VIGFLGSLHWAADLFSHFRVQYAVSLFVAAAILAIGRRMRVALLFAIFGVANIALIVPLFIPAQSEAAPPGAVPVKTMLMNVNSHFGDPTRVCAAIKAVTPDLLLLEEVTDGWLSDLRPALTNYPYSIAEPRDDNFGIALFSRLPFHSCVVTNIGAAGVPSIMAEIQTSNGSFTMLCTHPLPPAGAVYSAYRNEQLARLPGIVKDLHGPVVVMGDLNATPWSAHFRRLLRDSGLLDSERGRGLQPPSWPAHNFLLRIPLDHFLHSRDVVVNRRCIGPDNGSDHYPLIVEFVIASNSDGRPDS
jgi:endonuclease/exonuclease/phosphatase (EEP) superfamily protein YafD